MLAYLRAVSSYIELVKSLDSPAVDESVAQLYMYRMGVDPYAMVESTGGNPLNASDFINKKHYLRQDPQAFKYFINACLIQNIEDHLACIIDDLVRIVKKRNGSGGNARGVIDPMDKRRFTRTHVADNPDEGDYLYTISTISSTTEKQMKDLVTAYRQDPSDNSLAMRLRFKDYKHGATYQIVAEIAQMAKVDTYSYHQREYIPWETIIQYLRIFTNDKNNPTRIMDGKTTLGVAWSYMQNLYVLETALSILLMVYNMSASQVFSNDFYESIEDSDINISDTAVAISPSVDPSTLCALQNTDGQKMSVDAIHYCKYMRHNNNRLEFA